MSHEEKAKGIKKKLNKETNAALRKSCHFGQ